TERKRDVVVSDGHGPEDDATEALDVSARGTEWGSAVHDALYAAGRGFTGAALRAACRNVLIAHERPVGPDGEPAELEELLSIVETVRASDMWRRAQAASHTLMEVPFAVRFTADEYAAMIGGSTDGAALEVIDG